MSTELRRRPPVPSPDASASETHIFLTNFLLALDFQITQEAAKAEAAKMRVDGKALYEKTEVECEQCFGQVGVSLYRELYSSIYGYVRIKSNVFDNS